MGTSIFLYMMDTIKLHNSRNLRRNRSVGRSSSKANEKIIYDIFGTIYQHIVVFSTLNNPKW